MRPNERLAHGNNNPSQFHPSDLDDQSHANSVDPNRVGQNKVGQNRVESNGLKPNQHYGTVDSEESPELLRWRADTLLDEMMLGGVDISAGGPSSAEPPLEPPTEYAQRTQQHPPQTVTNGASHEDHRPSVEYPVEYPQQPMDPQPPRSDAAQQVDPWRQNSWAQGEQAQDSQPQISQAQNPYTLPQPNMPAGYGQPDSQHSTHPTPQHIDTHGNTLSQQPALGVQQPYSQPTQPYPQPTQYNSPPQPPPIAAPYSQPYNQQHDQAQYNQEQHAPRPYSPQQYNPLQYNHPPPKERPAWNVVSGHANEYLDSVPRHESVRTNYSGYYPDGTLGARNNGAYGPQSTVHGTNGQSGYAPQLGPVVHERSSPFADSMAVGSKAQRHPNLLPRQSQLDMQALKQEMATLQEQVDTALPIGRDLTERAIHLLDKGSNILEHFPDRSAEVSYYIQQVRSILQRAEQRVFWSNIYRKRLSLYLVAWLLLSIVIILSCVLYPQLLASAAASITGRDLAGWFGQHITAFILTIGAGALGSSLGALLNMWRYGQSDHGFFDRKYGLLGVTLPIIGVIVGALGYLIFGVVVFILGINPTSLLLIALIPAVAAFIFGISQERIYGTAN